MVSLTRAFLILCLAWLAFPAGADAKDKAPPPGKVKICHIPPDDPENVQILEVSQEALWKHIERHGDSVLDAAGEVCDGRDNDCDREVDEDFPDLGKACSDGVGQCRREGVQVCNHDGTGTVCAAVAGEGSPEVCTGGLDEDCDGATDCGDSDCATDPACRTPKCGDGFVDPGEQCDDPQNECCVGCQINEGAECQIDANPCSSSRCSSSGACLAENLDGLPCHGNGVDSCSGPDFCLNQACYDNGPNASVDVPCNGLDEDCVNGDSQPSGPCATGLGGPCAVGNYGCQNGGVVCVPVVPPAPEETCYDGVDNDCNGEVDDGCPVRSDEVHCECDDRVDHVSCEESIPECLTARVADCDALCASLGHTRFLFFCNVGECSL